MNALTAPAWMDDADCRHSDPEAWFPHRTEAHLVAEARVICDTCPVQAACIDHALNFPPTMLHGIWGGTTQEERIKMAKEREKQQEAVA